MEQTKHCLSQQPNLYCQLKPEASDIIQPRNNSSSYKPSIWKYDFIQSLDTKYEEEGYKLRDQTLKEKVKRLFGESIDVLAKLELIDNIWKLGLSTLFEEEIHEALDNIASIQNNNSCVEEDLYTTALCFRLLRQHGYEISEDIFTGFVDEKGSLSTAKCRDAKGLIELFEASHLALEGETILDKAKVFSIGTLKYIHCSTNLDSELAEKIARALELPLHRRVPWFEVRWHINAYENNKQMMNTSLLELAKLNFIRVQAALQNDLREVSRWWRNLGLIENLNFSRDRLVESFMCAVGLLYDTEFRSFRKWLTKVVIFILVIDDIYDIYGSLQELQYFTNAVDRWDSKEIEHLPECMKISFQALYDTTNEMAYEIQKEKGWSDSALAHLKKAWADFCKSLLVEAKWCNEGHTPSLQEYLNNAWISSSGPLLSVHSFFSTMKEDTEETAHFLWDNQELLYNSSLVIRQCNDLGTSTAELERGDVASSILCYMRELDVSEEKARSHIKEKINKCWININGHCFTQSSSLKPFVNIITNCARVTHCLYQNGDGFGVQDRDTKEQILSLLIKPI
ncbi:alpha-farnesene synthase-like isoform X2 [Mangifera indica]|uniref:alpha-farnesene synthase-like isoform X2 n=1 Tax=Mangifera indica TaxID=29780 RepID=UPI001CF9D936|nr:alpha-farnesene synthase-like isoform X2 [Mangifera indica]